MALIDSHAHLTAPGLLERVPQLLDRCADAGVGRVISIATDVADSLRAIELAKSYDQVSATAGIHPHEAGKASNEDVPALVEIWGGGSVHAAGEMGLDYYYDFAPKQTQREVFARQLESAGEFELPLVIHCRDAHEDVVRLLLEHGYDHRRVVFHCFTGTAAEAAELAEHGWRLSLTGIVTFARSKELQEIARFYPADRLMLETDSPYLSPNPVRGIRPNEPAHVAHIARFLADLRGESLEELSRYTEENTRSFFGLQGPSA